MSQWNCCRTCLSTSSLNPIFHIPNKSKQYTDVLLTITGLKIEINDNLPQTMCTECISYINKHVDFRSQCQTAGNSLKQMANKELPETHVKVEKADNLDDSAEEASINSYETFNKDENDTYNEFEMSVEDALKRPQNINIDNLKLHTKTKVKLNYMEIDSNRGKKEKKGGQNVIVECEVCHKVFKSQMSVNNHYKTHKDLKVVCEHCGKKFMNKRRLLMHCKSKHGYEKTDKCSYCDYRGCNAELVKIHERLHTGERPYVCAECGAGFHRKSSYLQHVAIHLPEKTVQCEKCPALFKSVTLMRIHANRHKRLR